MYLAYLAYLLYLLYIISLTIPFEKKAKISLSYSYDDDKKIKKGSLYYKTLLK